MSSFTFPCQRVRQRLLTSKKFSCYPAHAKIPSHIRCISSTLPTNAQQGSVEHDPLKPRTEEDEDVEDVEERSPTTQAAYQNWLAGQGRHYKHPSFTGPKWLGGDVSFMRFTIAIPAESNIQASTSLIG